MYAFAIAGGAGNSTVTKPNVIGSLSEPTLPWWRMSICTGYVPGAGMLPHVKLSVAVFVVPSTVHVVKPALNTCALQAVGLNGLPAMCAGAVVGAGTFTSSTLTLSIPLFCEPSPCWTVNVTETDVGN